MSSPSALDARSREIFDDHLGALRRRTDRLLAWLMAAQWLFGVAASLLVSPRAWAGSESQVHLHVWAAVVVGGAISSLPALLAWSRPGDVLTRHVIAAGQMLTSALLIHLTGGRIETHFHVFGSLAFLAFYRDWPVLMTASAVVIADHALRGLYWPQSVYGVLQVQPWRFVEHAGWVIFEDVFLVYSIRQGLAELAGVAARQAQLERTNEVIEAKVQDRTRELEDANRKLDTSLRDLQAAHERVQESERLKSRFLANVSHELRTPLTLIMAPIEAALNGSYGELSEAHKQTLATVHANALRLFQMVTSLLDFSRHQAGRLEVHRQPTDVVALTKRIVADFQTLLARQGLRARVETVCEHPVVWLDRYLFERVAFNLLSNAIKFTPRGGAVSVTLRQDFEDLLLSVRDTGPGMDAKDQDGLFARFQQLDGSSTRRLGGAGLGLAIVKEFAELLGGSVSVSSEPGRGSEFSVRLPAARTQAAPAAPDEAPHRSYALAVADEPQPAAPAADSRLPRVLIAEDNRELALHVAFLLEKVCQTRIAANGDEALGLAREWQPQLVLSDVMMPGLDGIELCRALKADAATSSIAVILLTAMADRDDMLRGWKAGADEYLFKPFHPQELVTRVSTLLKAAASRELSQAAELAIERERLQTQFLANVSHELRTPIASIKGFAETLRRGGLDDAANRAEFVATIEKNADRLSKLVENLLGLARLDAKRVEASPSDVDLALRLAELVADFRPQLRRKRVLARVECAAGLLARCDADHFWQIMQNVLSNAVKFSPRQGSIVIAAAADGDSVVVSVSDEGPGIPDNELELVFERFQTSNRGVPEGGGTGLGLAIARSLAGVNGGRLAALPGVARGAVFALRLPAASNSYNAGDDSRAEVDRDQPGRDPRQSEVGSV